jgi:hypothetical protein
MLLRWVGFGDDWWSALLVSRILHYARLDYLWIDDLVVGDDHTPAKVGITVSDLDQSTCIEER